MSLDPGMVTAGRVSTRVDNGQITVTPAAGSPRVTRVEVVSLAEGDRLIVHVDGAAGLSGGGAQQIGEYIRAVLKLGDLPYDVPILVVSPGIRVTVARPG